MEKLSWKSIDIPRIANVSLAAPMQDVQRERARLQGCRCNIRRFCVSQTDYLISGLIVLILAFRLEKRSIETPCFWPMNGKDELGNQQTTELLGESNHEEVDHNHTVQWPSTGGATLSHDVHRYQTPSYVLLIRLSAAATILNEGQKLATCSLKPVTLPSRTNSRHVFRTEWGLRSVQSPCLCMA